MALKIQYSKHSIELNWTRKIIAHSHSVFDLMSEQMVGSNAICREILSSLQPNFNEFNRIEFENTHTIFSLFFVAVAVDVATAVALLLLYVSHTMIFFQLAELI